MQTLEEKNDTAWLDNLRVVATIAVVLLHVVAPLALKFGKISNADWWIANSIDSLVRFCVPVFVMLTGALLLPRVHTLESYLKKRVARIILPFLFWSIIYILHFLTRLPSNFEFSLQTVSKIAGNKLLTGASYHLWYIYMIIGIYLILPIIGTWVKKASEKEIIYFLGLWLLSVIVSNSSIKDYIPDFNLKYFSGFIGYLVLGYYLSLRTLNVKIATAMFCFGIIVCAFGTYYLSIQKGSLSVELYQYFSLPVIISSIGIFSLFKNLELKKSYLVRIRNLINKNSFGVYFIHILVLFYLNKFGLNIADFGFVIGIPLLTFLCFSISLVIIFLLKKIPFLCVLVG
ncbi:acyltransferase [Pedobacter namyangjuensis]|uniref:acyltransferase n=1 Tax=Pedobacter namyangjuensis TaxID=600626 RepID=UPI000DE4B295|nr:acyltransferase family protein [Pedobacter namyangjuensis]